MTFFSFHRHTEKLREEMDSHRRQRKRTGRKETYLCQKTLRGTNGRQREKERWRKKNKEKG